MAQVKVELYITFHLKSSDHLILIMELYTIYLMIVGILIRIFCSNLTMAQKEKNKFLHMGKYGNYSWPRRELAARTHGHIVLGALHMIHERSEVMTCGPIMAQGGIQALETMLFTLDRINNDLRLIPGVTLGILAKDDCDRDVYGLEQSVDFIRGKCMVWNNRGFHTG